MIEQPSRCAPSCPQLRDSRDLPERARRSNPAPVDLAVPAVVDNPNPDKPAGLEAPAVASARAARHTRRDPRTRRCQPPAGDARRAGVVAGVLPWACRRGGRGGPLLELRSPAAEAPPEARRRQLETQPQPRDESAFRPTRQTRAPSVQPDRTNVASVQLRAEARPGGAAGGKHSGQPSGPLVRCGRTDAPLVRRQATVCSVVWTAPPAATPEPAAPTPPPQRPAACLARRGEAPLALALAEPSLAEPVWRHPCSNRYGPRYRLPPGPGPG
jgi:hypothetical protein